MAREQRGICMFRCDGERGLRSLGRGVDERRPNKPIRICEWQQQAKKVVTKLLQTAELYSSSTSMDTGPRQRCR